VRYRLRRGQVDHSLLNRATNGGFHCGQQLRAFDRRGFILDLDSASDDQILIAAGRNPANTWNPAIVTLSRS